MYYFVESIRGCAKSQLAASLISSLERLHNCLLLFACPPWLAAQEPPGIFEDIRKMSQQVAALGRAVEVRALWLQLGARRSQLHQQPSAFWGARAIVAMAI